MATAGRSAALAGLAGLAAITGAPSSEAKTPGTAYCFNTICHRVLTLQTTAALIGREIEHETSFYDGCRQDVFNPCGLTSSGEVFRPGSADNAASPVYPDGTTLLLFNPDTRQAAVVRVNNAGPYWGRRKLDVSRATADKLGFRKKGIAKLKVMVIGVPTEIEARYRQRRTYETVAGPIGEYASMDDARRSIGGMLLTASSRFAGLRTSGLTTGALRLPQSQTNPAAANEISDRLPVATALVQTINLPTIAYSGTSRDPLAGLLRPIEPATTTIAAATIDVDTPSRSNPANSVAAVAVATPAEPAAPAIVATADTDRSGHGVATDSGADAKPVTVAAIGDSPFASQAASPSRVRMASLTPADAPSTVDQPSFDITPTSKPPAHAGPQLRYSLGEPVTGPRTIEIAVTRRVDVLTGDNQLQPVLGSLPLDVSTDMMEKDLNSGRVTQFSPKIPLTTLFRAPVGRLGLFARSVDHRMSISRKPDPHVTNRVSEAVRWARMRLTGATDSTTGLAK